MAHKPISPIKENHRVLVSVRIDESDFNAIDRLAQQRDLPFVSMLREIIKHGTKHADTRSNPERT